MLGPKTRNKIHCFALSLSLPPSPSLSLCLSLSLSRVLSTGCDCSQKIVPALPKPRHATPRIRPRPCLFRCHVRPLRRLPAGGGGILHGGTMWRRCRARRIIADDRALKVRRPIVKAELMCSLSLSLSRAFDLHHSTLFLPPLSSFLLSFSLSFSRFLALSLSPLCVYLLVLLTSQKAVVVLIRVVSS